MNRKKLFKGILLALGLVAAVAATLRFTRNVPPFTPPADRQLAAWGTADAQTAAALQAVLDEQVNALGVPGLQGYLRLADGSTWSGASGTTDLVRQNLLQPDDVLRVGSVTKSFTAMLVLKLVEQGKLALDEPIARWFPEILEAETITVRHLLDHTSGIIEIIPKVMMQSIIPSKQWTSDELVEIAAGEPLLFAPGERFEYSNTNYILLGLIAEDLTGAPVALLLHEQILDPLGLQHTAFIPYEAAPANLLTGYDRDFAGFPGLLDIGPCNVSWATSAFTSGALASNAEDLGRFFDALFSGDLVSAATLEQMTTFIEAPNDSLPEQDGYGLGLMRMNIGGREMYGHVGQFMGSSSIALYDPQANVVVAVTTNLSAPDLAQVAAGLLRVIQ